MKTNKFLSAVSALAIVGASSFALAQGTGGSAGGSAGSSSSGAGMSSGSGAGGSMGGSSGSGTTQSPSGSTIQHNSTPGSSATERGASQAQGSGKNGDRNAPARAEGRSSTDSQKSQAQDQRSGSGSSTQSTQTDSKSSTTVGSASSGGVNLTSEQRTMVREKVLTKSAPRVTNVNFALNVGTVVPSHVHVVTVPQAIIDIHPQWRGYRYFVANDEIVIVEPNSLKIVAVLNV